MSASPHLVTKYSGKTQEYSEKKFRKSLERSGAPPEVIDRVINKITKELYPKITTKKLYRKAFKLLHKESRPLAARYSLKRAIMDLGPSGFPFEKFVALIFNELGYSAETNLIYSGRCVSHEIDVIATRDKKKTFVECKFHNKAGLKSDLKVALYVQARANDIKEGPQSEGYSDFFLVTNTQFTSEAIKYGECAGLKMLGWNYPKNEPLKDVLESIHLHPVTCLTSLTLMQKRRLMEKNVLLCRDIKDDFSKLDILNLKQGQIKKVKHEINHLMDC